MFTTTEEKIENNKKIEHFNTPLSIMGRTFTQIDKKTYDWNNTTDQMNVTDIHRQF